MVCHATVEQHTEEYCPAHIGALARIRDAYPTWLAAFGHLTFKDFVEPVSRLSETGERVRELAKFLVQHPERWDKSEP